jgi:ribosomal protein S18 acetylase RimI-like enzyme
MAMKMRELKISELALLADIDTSSSEERYDLLRPETGAGLLLTNRTNRPPIEVGRWGANEIATRMDLRRRSYAGGCKFWGAFTEGRFVGFLLLSAEKLNGALEIFSIFVGRKFRGKGVGTRLIAAAEEQCAHSGIRSLYVSANLDGTVIDFYLKRGFQVAGLHSRCYRNKWGKATFIKEIETPNKNIGGEERKFRLKEISS